MTNDNLRFDDGRFGGSPRWEISIGDHVDITNAGQQTSAIVGDRVMWLAGCAIWITGELSADQLAALAPLAASWAPRPIKAGSPEAQALRDGYRNDPSLEREIYGGESYEGGGSEIYGGEY